MANRRRCYFNTSRVSNKETNDRSELSVVSTNCGGALEKMNTLFEDDHKIGPLFAGQLMFARGAGNFEVRRDDIENEFYCENHYEELISKWEHRDFKHIFFRKASDNTRKKVCSFPDGFDNEHKTNRPFTITSHLSFDDAKLFLEKYNQLLHVGIPLCRIHYDFIKKLTKENIENNEIEMASSSQSLTESSESSEYITPKKSPKFLDRPKRIVSEETEIAVINVAKSIGVDRILPNAKYVKLAENTQQKKAYAVKKITRAVVECIAPDKPQELWNRAFGYQKPNSEIDKQRQKALERVTEQYYAANTGQGRIEVLAQVASECQLKTLQQFIPDLTRFRFSKARHESERRRILWEKRPPKIERIRYKKSDVNLLLEFITSAFVMTGLPFGTVKTKLSNGETIELPATLRKHRDHEIILMFKSWLSEIGRTDVKMGYTTIKRILKACKASRHVALQCVDYFVAASDEAFEMINDELEKLFNLGFVDMYWKVNTRKLLLEARHYLNTDYRLHIRDYSRFADHCLNFGLSDHSNKKFQSTSCKKLGEHSHIHDLKCEKCLILPVTIQNIIDEILEGIQETPNIYVDDLNDTKEILMKCEKIIDDLKKHIMRSVFSDNQRTKLIENLKEKEALITMDYSQKFIPQKSKESQKDYYAKKGLSWHISHVFAIIDGKLVQHNVTHLLGFEAQNANAVIAVVNDLLKKLQEWGIVNVIFRSDNAAYYRNTELIMNIFEITTKMKIKVSRYSFSEAQAGKASADTEGSRMKRRMRDYLDSGENITDSNEMFKALQYGATQLKGLSIAVATVTSQTPKGNNKIANITKISDVTFNYEKKTLTFWQHYGFGPGETVKLDDFQKVIFKSELDILQTTSHMPNSTGITFWRPIGGETEEGKGDDDDLGTTNIDPEGEAPIVNIDHLFPCAKVGCIGSFKRYGNLMNHYVKGKHKRTLEKCSQSDYAINIFKEKLEGFNNASIFSELLSDFKEASEEYESSLVQGWAVRPKATRIVYTLAMKEFLNSEFQKYQETGTRIVPKEVQEKMKIAINDDGTKKFKVSERLLATQITGWVSQKLKKLRESETTIVENSEESDNEEDDSEIQNEPMFNDAFSAVYESVKNWEKIIPKGKENGEYDDADEDTEVEDDEENRPPEMLAKKSVKTPPAQRSRPTSALGSSSKKRSNSRDEIFGSSSSKKGKKSK